MVTMSLKNSQRSSESVEIIHGLMEKLKFMEEIRVKSFKSWQYENVDNCSVKKVCFQIFLSQFGGCIQISISSDGRSRFLL